MRAGFVGILGLPNAGKSTLLNALVGEKVSIVSPKPQTTRRRVTGIATLPEAQIIFVDTPGFIKTPKGGVHQFLIEELKDVAANTDVLLLVLSPNEPWDQQKDLIDLVQQTKLPNVIVWNKSDLKKPQEEDLKAVGLTEDQILVLSAVDANSEWKKSLLQTLGQKLPEVQASLYDPELFTTLTIRDLTSEIIREKVFLSVHQEVPFGVAVQIRQFDETEKLVRIHADLWVERESHKAIVIGRVGAMLKYIGTQARTDLEKLLNTKVYLELHVAVKPNWAADPRLMKELGYVVE